MSKAKDALVGEWRYKLKRLLKVSGAVLTQHNLRTIQLEPGLRADLVEVRGEIFALFEREQKQAEAEAELARLAAESAKLELEQLEVPWVPSQNAQQLQLELGDPVKDKPAVEIIGDTGELPAVAEDPPPAPGPAPDPTKEPVEVDLPEPSRQEAIALRILDAVKAGGLDEDGEIKLVEQLSAEFGCGETSEVDDIFQELADHGRIHWLGESWYLADPAQDELEKRARHRQVIQECLRQAVVDGADTPAKAVKKVAKQLGETPEAVKALWPPPLVKYIGKKWVPVEAATDEAVEAAFLEAIRANQQPAEFWGAVGDRFGLNRLAVDKHWNRLREGGRVVWDEASSSWREPAGVA